MKINTKFSVVVQSHDKTMSLDETKATGILNICVSYLSYYYYK